MTARQRVGAGRYLLGLRLGGGGMGEVWRATDEVLGRDVAVKLLRREYGDSEEFRARFRAEARSCALVNSPGIAQIYDYGEDTDDNGVVQAFLVLELVPGEALSDLLARRRSLDAQETTSIVAQAALALAAAHAVGVIHRDVKPGNLLLTADGRVKVTDFGIARAVGSAPLTRTGTTLGTAGYLAPETALHQQSTPASDIYALGVVAYECLKGTPPFVGDNPLVVALAHAHQPPPPLPPSVPARLAQLVMSCLAKDPAARPAGGAALAAALQELRAGGLVTRPQNLFGVSSVPQELRDVPATPHVFSPGTNPFAPPPVEPRQHTGRGFLVGVAALFVVLTVAMVLLARPWRGSSVASPAPKNTPTTNSTPAKATPSTTRVRYDKPNGTQLLTSSILSAELGRPVYETVDDGDSTLCAVLAEAGGVARLSQGSDATTQIGQQLVAAPSEQVAIAWLARQEAFFAGCSSRIDEETPAPRRQVVAGGVAVTYTECRAANRADCATSGSVASTVIRKGNLIMTLQLSTPRPLSAASVTTLVDLAVRRVDAEA